MERSDHIKNHTPFPKLIRYVQDEEIECFVQYQII